MSQPKWEQLAEQLKRQIEDGTYPPGSSLPPMDVLVAEGAGARATVHQAYRALETAGYVVMMRRRGTLVRDRTVIRIPLNRYGKVLRPGGSMGPWETATAEQGFEGRMISTGVELVNAPADVAVLLQLDSGEATVVRRSRRATINGETVQIQHAWYPTDVADAAGLDQPGKIEGGVLQKMVASGISLREATEAVTARMPTKAEAAELVIGTGVPVLLVQRLTFDRAGRPIELVQIIGAADRLELVYDELPFKGLA